MINSELIDYIKKAKDQGLSEETITNTLLSSGWQASVVKEGMVIASVPAVPKPPAPPYAPALAQPSVVTRPIRNYNIYSHYSVLLSIVLFFTLLTLANKIIGDITRHFKTDIATGLIVNALIILPFLLLAFALHYGLAEKGIKYQILSKPYYIVSAWLLIKLLFRVSNYILSTQVVYGVYIVLLLIVTVLTGVVFFVQKYLKHKD